ncbi:hypothetical protein [Desulfovibrio inopinatus]|uniref:hypothetical protein n=1 Tax=Desulfovibrio inopinatus TaxID=102109 RepID=UPI000407AFB3|nr:hypothetical protein [Desulfovibrio inopinatus]
MENLLKEYQHLLFDKATGFSITLRYSGSLKRQLIFCNQTYADMAGRSREDLLSTGDMRMFQTHEHTHAQSLQMQTEIENLSPFTGAFAWVHPEGELVFIEYMALPVWYRGRLFVIGIDRYMHAPKHRVSYH